MTIKYIRTSPNVHPLEFIPQGDWVDLAIAEDVELGRHKFKPVSMGIRVKLPKGFEAHVLPRSSTGKRYKVLCYNSMGLIDESYAGPEDIWHFLIYAPVGCKIPAGRDIAQFRIMPKMKASVWIKLKWLFTQKIKFVEVESFDAANRGGLGSTH